MSLSMVDMVAEEGGWLWKDGEEPWAFPVAAVEENGGKNLIDGGKIVTTAAENHEVVVMKGKKRSGGGGGGRGECDDHELHIWTERERRKKMRDMFATLNGLVPHLHPMADKSSTIEAAVKHIKQLKQTLESLEKLKQEREKGNDPATGCDQSREAFLAEMGPSSPQQPVVMNPGRALTFTTWTSENVVVNVCGGDALINVVSCAAKPGILSGVALVLDKYNLDLVSAHASSDTITRNYMFHVRANAIVQQFADAPFLVEETYKQAAAELMLWISSL